MFGRVSITIYNFTVDFRILSAWVVKIYTSMWVLVAPIIYFVLKTLEHVVIQIIPLSITNSNHQIIPVYTSFLKTDLSMDDKSVGALDILIAFVIICFWGIFGEYCGTLQWKAFIIFLQPKAALEASVATLVTGFDFKDQTDKLISCHFYFCSSVMFLPNSKRQVPDAQHIQKRFLNKL